jgi:cytochrome c biogenesis protein CcmG/thiol:disulfide interchange protein DsbE
MVDAPAPVFTLAPIKSYEEGFSSADLQGQVSLVNIFASWCVACLYEHPVLMDIKDQPGVPPIYGLAWKDPAAREREASGDPGATTAWLERHGDPYTAVGDDADGRVAIDFAVTGAPETFVIDKQGRIRYKHPGVITPENWRRVFLPLIAELERE